MNKNLGIIFIFFISFLQLCFAGASSSSATNGNTKHPPSKEKTSSKDQIDGKTEMPVITNEAEYAAWVRSRDGIKQSNSVKSTRPAASNQTIKAASSSAKKAIK